MEKERRFGCAAFLEGLIVLTRNKLAVMRCRYDQSLKSRSFMFRRCCGWHWKRWRGFCSCVTVEEG
jgi:hypothetical protein